MFRGLKYRLYPTDSQKELIAKHIGCCRFVYNLALETKNSAYLGSKHNFSAFDLINQLPDLKRECTWLKEVNSQSLQAAILNMDKAFKGFFNSGGFPKFKSKSRGKHSFSIPEKITVQNGTLVIPKFREGIRVSLHRPIIGTIKSAAVSVTPSGKYFVSILVDTATEPPTKALAKNKTTIGIDLGIKTFAVTSNGQEVNNPKYLSKAQAKLKYVQRKYSKHKGKRTKHKLALLHEKVANQRKDFLHKVSSELIKNHDSIAIENLQIAKMLKERRLSQSIGDAGWGMFVDMLEYKAEWYGKNILRIGTYEPSSKTCSCCGTVNKELTLQDREWTCVCGEILDRDFNAAINIKKFALRDMVSGTETQTQNELPAVVGVLTSVAHFG